MKKVLCSAAVISVLAAPAMAGGLSDPQVTPEVVLDDAVETASSSSAPSLVLLMSLIVLGAAAGG